MVPPDERKICPTNVIFADVVFRNGARPAPWSLWLNCRFPVRGLGPGTKKPPGGKPGGKNFFQGQLLF